MATFGFIGCGNMGGAIAAAVAKAHDPRDLMVSSKSHDSALRFAAEHGMVAADNTTIARECRFVMLGVKPQYMAQVLKELKPILEVRTDCTLVTMAAGLTMQQIANMVGGGYPVIRIMPNTPARIGEGVVIYDYNDRCKEADVKAVLEALAPAGLLDHLPEKLIDAGSALAGSGPAFVSVFMEALADAGVSCGLPRKTAMEYAARTLIGTARLMLQTGDHPGKMKDAVCSPGGSTIAGIRALEREGMRGAVMEAVIATYEKNKNLV